MKLSHFVAALSWASVFGLSWYLILDLSRLNWLSGVLWFFFLFVAMVTSSIVTYVNEPKPISKRR